MRFHVHADFDVELDAAKVMERYGTGEPTHAAEALKHSFESKLLDDLPPEISNVVVIISPIYG